MSILVAGLVVLLGIHLLPSFSSVRDGLVESWGEKKYKGIYSLVSAVGLGLIIWGFATREIVEVFTPPAWGRPLAHALMPISFILLAAPDMKPNNIKRIVKHPMLWGVTLWAAVHLANNGDMASLLLFGGFLVFAIIDLFTATARGKVPTFGKQPITRDLTVVAVGLVGYGVFMMWLHEWLIGVPVV